MGQLFQGETQNRAHDAWGGEDRLPTIRRFGKLSRVFKDGQSELLNGIARLSVLYEDLRLEIGELQQLHATFKEAGTDGIEYRLIYFLRRSLSTLVEFRGALTTVRRTSEFKHAEAALSAMDADYILKADTYLQQNWTRIKELRNEFGGHVQLNAAKFATTHVEDVVGHVTWNRSCDGWTIGLECHFAADIVSGAISSQLQAGADARGELRKALNVIVDGFNHAQAATCALVHAFLWDRFGV